MKVKVCLGTGFVRLCRSLEAVLKAEIMAVLQPEGRRVVLCQMEAAEVETGAVPAACFLLMGGDKSALQHLLAQKERKDSNPEPDLVGFNCCKTMQCYILWSQSNKVVHGRVGKKEY